MNDSMSEQNSDKSHLPPALSVTELTKQLSSCVSHYFREMWVEGEVGKVREIPSHGKGSIYLTIKDDQSAIDAVIWSRQRYSIKYIPKKGDLIRVRGNVRINEKQGSCSLHIQHVEPTGQGLLLLQLEERRARLYAHGVFARELPLPRIPKGVALITSQGSDAEIDFLKVATERAPGIPIYVYDARMQGDEQSVVQGLKNAMIDAAARPDVEVLVLTRGGGLGEHLWVFNNEDLCRFISSAPLPIVVSIGHESNLLLAELAADMRTSTPTYAAMAVIPDTRIMRRELDSMIHLLQRGIERQGAHHSQRLQLMLQGLRPPSTQGKRQVLDHAYYGLERAFKTKLDQNVKQLTHLEQLRERRAPHARLVRVGQGIESITKELQRYSIIPSKRLILEQLERELHQSFKTLLQSSQGRFLRLIASLHALSPLEILSRGYSITTRIHRDLDGEVQYQLLDNITDLSIGDRISIQLLKGRLEAEVHEIDPHRQLNEPVEVPISGQK